MSDRPLDLRHEMAREPVWAVTREQLVQQHAERIDVASRVGAPRAHAGLFGTHVLGVPINCPASVRSNLPAAWDSLITLATPKSMTSGAGRLLLSDQHVRRLEIPMQYALLVGVLDGLAAPAGTARAARGLRVVWRRRTR